MVGRLEETALHDLHGQGLQVSLLAVGIQEVVSQDEVTAGKLLEARPDLE